MFDPLKLKILYEDNHLLALEKPVNIPTQGDKTNDLDLLTLAKENIRLRYDKPGNVYLGLLHRLDRPVGGVVVIAKTSKSAARMSELIRTHTFHKRYIAIVHGSLESKNGELRNHLFKIEKLNFSKVTKPDHKGSKEAILNYQVLDEKNGFSKVEIELKTGRHHQIRVQFSEIKHPLFGDQKYGKSLNKPGQQLALWAYQVQFNHPVTQQPILIESKTPQEYPWDLFQTS